MVFEASAVPRPALHEGHQASPGLRPLCNIILASAAPSVVPLTAAGWQVDVLALAQAVR